MEYYAIYHLEKHAWMDGSGNFIQDVDEAVRYRTPKAAMDLLGACSPEYLKEIYSVIIMPVSPDFGLESARRRLRPLMQQCNQKIDAHWARIEEIMNEVEDREGRQSNAWIAVYQMNSIVGAMREFSSLEAVGFGPEEILQGLMWEVNEARRYRNRAENIAKGGSEP